MKTIRKCLETREALERFAQYLSYDEKSGDLVWLQQKANRSPVGTIVGSSTNGQRPHREMEFDGNCWQVSRIVYALHNGKWPDHVVHHKNNNALDNRVENLVDLPQRLNSRKRKKHCNNTSGYVGVYVRCNGRYTALYHDDHGRQRSAGTFDTPVEAAKARTVMLKGKGYEYYV